MTCSKIKYTKIKAARKQAKYLAEMHSVPQYIYTCRMCKHLHLTSEEPGTREREII